MKASFWLLGALASTTVSGTANAAEFMWFDSDHSSYNGDYLSGQALTFTSPSVTAKVTAWSIGSDNKISQAQLGVWSEGIGVKNGSGDNSHTIDNSGRQDFIVIQFDKLVQLANANFKTGWHNLYDTDATIGYLNSQAAFSTPVSLNGASLSSLSSYNLYASNGGNISRNINPDGNLGNVWLIGASFNNPEGSKSLDGFKFEKVSFSVAAVPEPATWMMMILGFGFVGGALRSDKRQRKVSVSYA